MKAPVEFYKVVAQEAGGEVMFSAISEPFIEKGLMHIWIVPDVGGYRLKVEYESGEKSLSNLFSTTYKAREVAREFFDTLYRRRL